MIATSFFTDKLISNSPILRCSDYQQTARKITTWQISTTNNDSSSLDYQIILRNTQVREEKYIFIKPSIFQQYGDGTANLLGVIVDIDNPYQTWNLNIWFQTSEGKNSSLLPNIEKSRHYKIHQEYPPVLIGGGDYLGNVLHLYENSSGLELSLNEKKNSFEILMSGSFGCVGLGKSCFLEIRTNLAEVINITKKNNQQKLLQSPLPRVNHTNLLNFDSSSCQLVNL